MANKINLINDDFEYEASSSENEYTERERKLLKNVKEARKRNEDDNKEELFKFDDSESDENIRDSDIEEVEDDDIPDSRAWGKKRGQYYNADFVDQDYGTYNEQEEELALAEEEEAKSIQQRLAQQLDEADFSLDIFCKQQGEIEKDSNDSKLKFDLNDLSQRQKLQLFQKESPEFSGLVADFEKTITECNQLLRPILEYVKTRNLDYPIFEFVKVKNKLAYTYLTNIAFYLLLKAKKVQIKNHPIIKRLVQLRQLIMQLEEKYENIVKPQITKILELINTEEDIEFYVPNPRSNFTGTVEIPTILTNQESQDENEDNEENERRKITYQIAKNKGLMPHRKRELRNPRVKHKNKFRRALIRRKGAVRNVRTETKRYGGEISGIKATVKKSVKIKS